MIDVFQQIMSESLYRHFLSSIFTILKRATQNRQRFKSVLKRLSTMQFLFGYSIARNLLQRYSSNSEFLLGYFLSYFGGIGFILDWSFLV